MNTLLNNILNDINNRSSKLSPVKESGDVYLAEFELAGFTKKDVDIQVADNTLTIKAKNEHRDKSFKLFLYFHLLIIFIFIFIIFNITIIF